MWLFEPVIVVREVSLLFFVIEFLIGVLAIGLALLFKSKEALWLFFIGSLGNMLVEIVGLITGTRVYDAPLLYKPFMGLSIGMGEAGAAMCFTWLIATKIWSYMVDGRRTLIK